MPAAQLSPCRTKQKRRRVRWGASGRTVYAYVGGNPVNAVDPLGLDYNICTYPGAGGFGHIGVGVNSSKTYGYYPNEGSAAALTGTPGIIKRDEKESLQCTTGKSTPAQDAQMKLKIAAVAKTPGSYTFTGNNCVNFVRSVLSAAGISSPNSIAPFPFFNGLPKPDFSNVQGSSGP